VKVLKIYDGNVHHQIGGYFIDAVAALFAVIVVVFIRDWWLLSRVGLVWFAARLGNEFLSPDLDLTRSVPLSKWKGLKWIWMPYSYFLKHRSIWSHGINVPVQWKKVWWKSTLLKNFGFLIGTLVRSLYLSCIVLFVSFVLDWIIGIRLFTVLTPHRPIL
jgi:uncharacterized metal-binding protein